MFFYHFKKKNIFTELHLLEAHEKKTRQVFLYRVDG